MAILPGFAAAGMDQDYLGLHYDPLTYDEMRPGCYEQAPRLEDMDENHTEVSLSFPTFPRFCGQTFLEHGERDLALACVRAYNDWMIDEWCAGAGYGRLIPLTLIPLWDPELAAAEVRRCAAKGSFAVAFSGEPGAARSCRASSPTTGTRSSPPARNPTRSSTCTSVRRRRSR